MKTILTVASLFLSPLVCAASTDTVRRAPLCQDLFMHFSNSAPISRSSESLEEWRQSLNPEVHYKFEPVAEGDEIVLYNWGPGHYSFNTLSNQGLSGQSLLKLTQRSHAAAMGLYVANNPFGRTAHGDTLMEVVVYKNQRPSLKNKKTSWVPVTDSEFREDQLGGWDRISTSAAGGNHQDYVIIDPRVIKEFRWPQKQHLLDEIQAFPQKMVEVAALNQKYGRGVDVEFSMLPAYVQLIEQVFSGEGFTNVDRIHFFRKSAAAKVYIENQWNPLVLLFKGGSSRNLNELSTFRASDRFFKIAMGSDLPFLNYGDGLATLSIENIITASRKLDHEHFVHLKNILGEISFKKNKLSELIEFAMAIHENNLKLAEELFDRLRSQFKEACDERSTLQGWNKEPYPWRTVAEKQMAEFMRAEKILKQL